MIVGTAGHIDHGKSTLVAALTGMDADRLPEEKKRGISIELGYAWLDMPGEAGLRIGFVDVPGHERLVHTMLAGATGIDYALLLVAADDGPMPQTREHLAVLSLLGLARGAVAITKCDLVDASRVAEVSAQASALLHGTPLEDAPVLPVSARSGGGVEALRALLFEAARETVERARHDQAFRLAIDRVFVLDGVGTVVTGTAHAGRVRVGDELMVAPSERPRQVRVRGLHVHDRRVEEACAGQRCAFALAGASRDDIARGQWLVAPAAALATDRIDLRLTVWREEARSLRSGTPVHAHLGAGDVLGTVALLDGDALAPGASARAQLVLREPVAAWHGDRVVLRDASATRTIAGGAVLDAHAPARYRRTPKRMAELDACALDTPAARLAGLLAAATHGVDLERWVRGQGLRADMAPPLPPGCLHAGEAGSGWALDAAHAASAREAALAALRDYHGRVPDELGPDAGRLRRLSAPRLPEKLWQSLLAQWVADGDVALRGPYVHLPEHGIRLSASEERIAQKTAPQLAQAGFEGAWVRDLARDAREPEPLMRTTLARMARRGDLHQVVRDLYYPPQAIVQLAALARAVAARDDGVVTAARFRDATGLGRKRAIQILEYFDRVGLLRRVGDTHKLRTDTLLFTEESRPVATTN
jgi:selenocysteine-specific elongation factor